ncbi:unnamed protein product [Orchesella dallaii]|uniref:Ionotropic glutamate receptor L-glutamate and glycine-binding domain-containing protein n=1 Tax=Orchesella dallaii TaxID=48710 RepID=A0ABP1PRM8_9HEXA
MCPALDKRRQAAVFIFRLEASKTPRRESHQKNIRKAENFIFHSQEFIHKLLYTHFKNCELLHIAQNHSTPEYSHQYLEKFTFSSGNFIATFSSNVTYNRSQDVHRFNTVACSIALIFVSEYSVELSKWLFETITPTYSPIIRKDEDHFIFVSFSATASDQVLMSPQFGNKIRYKISLTPETDESKTYSGMLVKTVNLYGKPKGQPVLKELVRLDAKATSIQYSKFQNTQDIFPDTTRSFNGKVFRVSNPRSKTYFDVEIRDGKYYGKRGLYKIWLDVMMERYNFSVDVCESSLSGGSGKQLPNGTWGGTVGDVMYGVADMGAFVGHTFSRDKLIGYSATITYEWMFFITHKPKTYYTSTAIFRPLSFVLWIGFFISLIFMGFTFKILLRDQWSFASMINFIVTSFLEQDADHYINLRSTSVRVLVTFWLIFSLIFSTAYRGKLVSLIAFPAMSWVPWTYEDLAYSNFRAGLHVVGKGKHKC